jgi:1-aminocyclopropane-1-carboxylate deaminase
MEKGVICLIINYMFNENLYAPIEKVNFELFEQKQIELFIKREDLIHPFIAGNKWRKLTYILQDASSKNKKHLVTFGGAYSNHLLAVACAGAKYHLTTTGFVRGEELSNHMLGLCRWFGMNLIFIDRESYRNKSEIFDTYFSNNYNAYFIEEGGVGELGAKGCGEILKGIENEYSHVFCSVGTGCTIEGLIGYANEHKLKASIEGIVVLKGGDFLQKQIEKKNFNQANWRLHQGFHEGGYAKTSPELLAFIQHFASQTGILIDQVYEGKMMKAIFSLAEENYFKKGSKILAIHCGGTLGMLSVVDVCN